MPPPPAAPLDRTIRLYRAYAALAFSFAWVPVMFVAFTRDRGFSGEQYLQLWAAYYLAMVAAEVPWGILADRVGTRPLLLAGPLGLAASFLVLGHARAHGTCLLAMAATGACHAMISGADSAYLYRALQRAGARRRALREEAGAHRLRNVGVSGADVIGGFCAAWAGTAAAFDASAAIMLAAAAVAWRLPPDGAAARTPATAGDRPPPAGAGPPAPARRTPRLADGLRTLARPGVRWVLLFYTVTFVFLRVGFQLYQPTLLAVGLDDPRLLGIVFASLNLVTAATTWLVGPLHGRWGERRLATFVVAALGTAFLGLAALPGLVVLALFCLQQASFGFLDPVGRTALNHRIPSAERASLLSSQSMVARLLFGVTLWGLGLRAGVLTDRLAGLYLGLAAAALIGAALVFATHEGARLKPRTGPDILDS